jgi:ubiquinone/menaquinone biosynthesis C-methylase UbiE
LYQKAVSAILDHMESWDEESATAAGYDQWAASYDDSDPSTWLDEPFLLEHLKPFPACRILDMGCGTGRYLRRLTPSTYRITGIDRSRNMLSRARQTIGNRKDISLVHASVTCLPFHPHSFDRIMSGLVIDHVVSAEQFFMHLSDVLVPGGRAVVAAVHPDMQRMTGSDIDVRRDAEKVVRIHGHVHEVTHLLSAARDAGMTVLTIEEPRVTSAMLEHRPDWKDKIGCRALLLLALLK